MEVGYTRRTRQGTDEFLKVFRGGIATKCQDQELCIPSILEKD